MMLKGARETNRPWGSWGNNGPPLLTLRCSRVGKINPARSLSSAYLWNRERCNGVFLWLSCYGMLHLIKVYRQPEIQDGGRKTVKVWTLMAILEATVWITIPVTNYIWTNSTIISMFGRSFSRMPLISIPHNLKTEILSWPFPSPTPQRQTRPLFCCRRCTTKKISIQTVKTRSLWWFWTTAPPRVQWIPSTWWSTGQVLHERKVNQTITNETFILMLPDWVLPLFGLWPIQRGNAVTQTTFIPVCRCYDMMKQHWLTTGHSQPTCHIIMQNVCRAMLAIGVEPVASTSAAPQQAARNVTHAGAAHNITHRTTEGWASLHRVSAVCVWQAPKKTILYSTTMWSVHCGCNLTLAVMSKVNIKQ